MADVVLGLGIGFVIAAVSFVIGWFVGSVIDNG